MLLDTQGPPARAITALARELGSSLIVLGGRRLRGRRALTTVAEQVADEAACSVLVARATTTTR